ncbi:MAG TPA: hypothetical protein VI451_00890 [Anaerolineales bacterium]|nr:hypothetical protein [Anaerolineales bacterium]
MKNSGCPIPRSKNYFNLSAPRPELQANLAKVREMLVQRVGEPKEEPVDTPRKWYEKIFSRK